MEKYSKKSEIIGRASSRKQENAQNTNQILPLPIEQKKLSGDQA
jgi:hypothetical protein